MITRLLLPGPEPAHDAVQALRFVCYESIDLECPHKTQLKFELSTSSSQKLIGGSSYHLPMHVADFRAGVLRDGVLTDNVVQLQHKAQSRCQRLHSSADEITLISLLAGGDNR